MKVLTTKDAAEWHQYVQRLPVHLRDCHVMPEMMLPYEETGMGHGACLVYEEGDEVALWPRLYMKDGTIRHPYNFGGPVSTQGYQGKLSLADEKPTHCTLNPFYSASQARLLHNLPVYAKDIVWVDLTKATIRLRQTTRHSIEEAESQNLAFAVVPIERDTVVFFAKMYELTMRRRNAAPHWYFSEAWFLSFFKNCPNASLCIITHNGLPIAGCALVGAGETCYYHFAASVDGLPLGTNHFMVHRTILWSRLHKALRFCLGGGVDPDDGLFRFKAGFSKLRLPVFRYSEEDAKCHAA